MFAMTCDAQAKGWACKPGLAARVLTVDLSVESQGHNPQEAAS